MRWSVVAVALIACACRTRGFVKPAATEAHFYRDLLACEKIPQWHNYWGDVGRRPDEDLRLRLRRNKCMVARGWKLSREPHAFRPTY